jgi:hypothetical protein
MRIFIRNEHDFILNVILQYNEVQVALAKGRAMTQALSPRPSIAEARVRSRVSPCGICGGQSGTGTGSFSEYFGVPLSVSFHRCSSTWKMTKNNDHHLHLYHRVAQEAVRLWCVRSACCGALLH